MAIDTDKLKNGSKVFGGTHSRVGGTPASEGGGDMALALTSTVQGQSNEMAIAAQAAAISIDHASEQLSDYFADVMTGRSLLNATLAKTAAKIEAQGRIEYATDVPPITVDLPKFGGLAETRRGFMGLFNAEQKPANPFLAPSADEVASDD